MPNTPPLTVSTASSAPGTLAGTVTDAAGAVLASFTANFANSAPLQVPINLAPASVTVPGLWQNYPGMPGEVYPTNALLAQFAPYADAYGDIDYLAFAKAGNYLIAYVSDPATHQPGDYATFTAAQAAVAATALAGSQGVAIVFRRGSTITPAILNDDVQCWSPNPKRPLILCSTDDLQNPQPSLQYRLALGGTKFTKTIPIANIIVAGLSWYEPWHDPTNSAFNPATYADVAGVIFQGPAGTGVQNFIVDDCHVNSLAGAFCFNATSGVVTSVIIRKSSAMNCWGGTSQRWCIYAAGIQDLLVAENTLNLNGWAAPTATWPGSPKGVQIQSIYLQTFGSPTDPQTRSVDNLVAQSSAAAIEQRSGGYLSGVFVANPTGVFAGIAPYPVLLTNILSTGSGLDCSIGAASPRGWGVFCDAAPTATFQTILCCDKVDPVNTGWAFQVQCRDTSSTPNVPTNAQFIDCIAATTWNSWQNDQYTVTGTPGTITFQNCNIAPNRPTAPPVYPSPNWTLQAYALEHGFASVPAFLAAAASTTRGARVQSLTAASIRAAAFAAFDLTPET